MKKFITKNKIIILLVLITICGAYLRLYRFGDLARFNTDQVRDTVIVEKIMKGNSFPLLGPKAGGTLFKLGPAFYYIETFSGFIFGNTPSGIALIVGILSVVSIPLLFFFLKNYFPNNISLFLTLIYSFSFYAIKYSRFAWNPNIIPFFFILFLLSLLKIIQSRDKKIEMWHILLAVSMGIGTQLHTLLLILMPVLFLLAYAYIFIKEKKLYWGRIIIMISAVLLLNLPFFVYDFQNNGKNLKSFFAGTEKKTEKNSSLIDNALKDGQFFIQGNTYAISSFEPQKNWIKAKKILDSKDTGEITAAFMGTLFGLFGFFYLIRRSFSEKDEKKRTFLGLVLAINFLSFLILLPIANELNVRYFIILIFLPYIFLGFFIEFLLKNIRNKLALSVILVSFSFLAVLNLRTYAKTYDLENYTARTSSYGGISVKEAEDISNFMLNLSKRGDPNNINFSVPSFKFSPSIEYFNDKKNLNNNSPRKESAPGSINFVIYDYEDIEKNLKKMEDKYSIIDSLKTGRFTVFAVKNKD